MVKTYFHNFTGAINIADRQVPKPVVHIHTVTTARITTAITFTSAWFPVPQLPQPIRILIKNSINNMEEELLGYQLGKGIKLPLRRNTSTT